jgi:hypothetical protein
MRSWLGGPGTDAVIEHFRHWLNLGLLMGTVLFASCANQAGPPANGVVVVRFIVDESGRVIDPEIVSSDYAGINEPVIEGVLK